MEKKIEERIFDEIKRLHLEDSKIIERLLKLEKKVKK